MSNDNDDKIDRLFNAADEAWEDGDLGKAFDLFRQCAELGDVPAMLNAGYFLDEGLGVKPDKAGAMGWYRKAYELGDASAANNIAILHREQNDLTGAFEWFGKAVELGDPDANVELAKIHLHGLGVPKSDAKAREHLEKALTFEVDHEDADDEVVYISEAGHEEAVKLLAKLDRSRG
ncbi:MAG: sel1 repeat family protein [Caulobacter sp.]|nr:sel1 repeat family protein [Caulobacter sp.]